MRNNRFDRGAAAVEFALVMPILMALLLGIMIFSRAYQVQSSLSMAAREGAREMAINGIALDAKKVAEEAAYNLGVTGTVATPNACVANPEIAGDSKYTTVQVVYDFDFLGVHIEDMTGTGVMRCGG